MAGEDAGLIIKDAPLHKMSDFGGCVDARRVDLCSAPQIDAHHGARESEASTEPTFAPSRITLA
jgi:hypothetical protein